uniref:Transposase, Ptta/En/Spm, plant n=1 Tax=Lactuca sativa TaxID=4236 RepID=A0A9R1VNT4_LACSA|nr:hypothetical protein LSAT_V11C400163090 [Lactuca sativa]
MYYVQYITDLFNEVNYGSVPGARSSPLPDPSGLPRIPLTGGSVPGVRSSPLSDPSGLPRSGFVSGASSSPLPDPSCLPHNIFTGSSVSGGWSSPELIGLQHNPFLVSSTPRDGSSPGPNGLPRIPLPGGLSRTSVRTTRSGFSGSSSMGATNSHMGFTDAIADTGVVQNVGNGSAYGYEMTSNNEEPASDFFYNGPEHEHEPESVHEPEPESPMVQTPHYSGTHGGSNDADSNGSHRPFITRKGYKFGRQSIHRTILKIFWQSINEPWITFKKIPKEVVTQMFERFRTQYRWDPNEEGMIREGFENMLKDRYRGRMRDVREASVKSARKAGHDIAEINDNFEILANYNPGEIHRDVWRRLCRKWDTDDRKKLSKSGKKTVTLIRGGGGGGGAARHTGGSIGFEKHRLKLKLLTGEDPSFIDLYYKTHFIAESKKIYFGGDKAAPVDFVNETSRVALESYNKALSQKYGDDPTQHNVNDPELWTQTQLLRKGGKQKGAYSYESTSASANFAKSQQEVNELRQQVSNMQQAMDEKQSEMNMQMQQMRNDMELQMQRQLAAFMKQINPSVNPPIRSFCHGIVMIFECMNGMLVTILMQKQLVGNV